jgi:hypothetical protein
MVAVMSDGAGVLKTPAAGMSSLCSIKTNFVNLIHQADLQVNGKTIESTQPFLNVARHHQHLVHLSACLTRTGCNLTMSSCNFSTLTVASASFSSPTTNRRRFGPTRLNKWSLHRTVQN